MAWQPGIITTDVPALPAKGLADRLRAFVNQPWTYRRRYLQSVYRTAFDGYSFQGQADSLNQGPEDALHSFVLSDFSPRSAFPAEFQPFLRDGWPALTQAVREIERGLLVQLGVEGLLEPYDASYGHMMSANYYPSGIAAQPKGGVRLTEHPDVSLLTLFPFGVESGLEYQDAEGAWRAVVPCDRVVGFAGELLEWLTAGRIQALNHRVANGSGQRVGKPFDERFSFSLFSLPRPGTRIAREAVGAPSRAGPAMPKQQPSHLGAVAERCAPASPEAISVEAYIEAHLSRWL
ncbi:MAG: hypothetical protein OXF68_14795 [Gammaproteobacteria bacterium]|nr:hypothetical protein [Gammaproteobacteria bacterium]MCY4343211.1 hypothetical protein [Gammaproteobacteria bacterium]